MCSKITKRTVNGITDLFLPRESLSETNLFALDSTANLVPDTIDKLAGKAKDFNVVSSAVSLSGDSEVAFSTALACLEGGLLQRDTPYYRISMRTFLSEYRVTDVYLNFLYPDATYGEAILLSISAKLFLSLKIPRKEIIGVVTAEGLHVYYKPISYFSDMVTVSVEGDLSALNERMNKQELSEEEQSTIKLALEYCKSITSPYLVFFGDRLSIYHDKIHVNMPNVGGSESTSNHFYDEK